MVLYSSMALDSSQVIEIKNSTHLWISQPKLFITKESTEYMQILKKKKSSIINMVVFWVNFSVGD